MADHEVGRRKSKMSLTCLSKSEGEEVLFWDRMAHRNMDRPGALPAGEGSPEWQNR